MKPRLETDNREQIVCAVLDLFGKVLPDNIMKENESFDLTICNEKGGKYSVAYHTSRSPVSSSEKKIEWRKFTYTKTDGKVQDLQEGRIVLIRIKRAKEVLVAQIRSNEHGYYWFHVHNMPDIFIGQVASWCYLPNFFGDEKEFQDFRTQMEELIK